MNTKSKSSITSRVKSTRETRNLKSKARLRIGSKSDLIRSLNEKGLSPSEILQRIKKRGLSIYASEVYRITNA